MHRTQRWLPECRTAFVQMKAIRQLFLSLDLTLVAAIVLLATTILALVTGDWFNATLFGALGALFMFAHRREKRRSG